MAGWATAWGREWAGDSWVFFFSHPADFTPVCTTEMGRTAQLADEFAARNVKPLGLSTDSVAEHREWIEDVNATQNTDLRFPIVADTDHAIARQYDMIHPGESETAAVRSVFIIDPDKKIRIGSPPGRAHGNLIHRAVGQWYWSAALGYLPRTVGRTQRPLPDG